jgi:DNA-binding SARP family transcriptional activator/TolB-like protein
LSVSITTLGRVRVVVDGREKSGLPQQRLRCALLIYLAAETEASRETLAATFWPDKPNGRARHILSQTIYELRGMLGEEAIDAEGERVRIGPGVRIDVQDFERAVARGDREAAIAAYGGAFLAGFTPPNVNSFETWVDRKRATLERLHRRTRRERIQALDAAGDTAGALAEARAWADFEPLEDEAQHRLFELLLRMGQRIEARTRFEHYQRQLRKELDVAPLDETVALFDRVFEENDEAGGSSSTSEPVVRMDDRLLVDVLSAAASRRQQLTARRSRWVAIAGFVIAVAAVGAAVAYMTGIGEAEVSSIGLEVDSTGLDASRIAVLYFDDHSENARLGHVANGLTEALIGELQRVEALSVVSRHGVKRFAGRAVPLDSITSVFRVGSIIDGSLQISGDRLRVTVQLVDASTGLLVESDTVQRDLGELFELQDDIAQRVARFLRQRLGRVIELQRLKQEGGIVEAWVLVQQAIDLGRSIWETETNIPTDRVRAARHALRAADSLLERSEHIAPKWAEPTLLRGWAAIGQAKVAGIMDTIAYDRALLTGLDHAARLFARDSVDARAFELRGTLRFFRFRADQSRPEAAALLDGAQADLEEAINHDRRLASALNTLSRLLHFAGDPAQANVYANRAFEQDAYLTDRADILQRLWRTAMDMKDFDQAWKWCRRGGDEYPGDRRFVECQLTIPALTGDGRITPDSARVLIAALDAMDPPAAGREHPPYRFTFRRVLMAAVLIRAGDEARARAEFEAIRREVARHPELAVSFAWDDAAISVMLGDTDAALLALEQYVAAQPLYRTYAQNSFLLEALRDHPRFQDIVSVPAAR